MHIALKLFATLLAYAPENAESYPIAPGTTVRQIIETLGIPVEEAKLVFVNSTRRDFDTPLADGDRVGIFPPVGGG